jgi:EAL domain-containing protein (putative c-di-GMP-specific phosphodiesterase class I)
VSSRQFKHADFVQQVCDTLTRTGADPSRLKLELTESLLVDDMEMIIDKMMLLRAKGVSFSLDDFGTGYSSLAYLRRLPLDQLKIDQSFVRDVLTDPNDAAIARTVITLAHSMDLTVVAEGVETEGQRDFLARNGCREFQGYLFGRPAPVEALKLLARGPA